jgi:hypothetical protein
MICKFDRTATAFLIENDPLAEKSPFLGVLADKMPKMPSSGRACPRGTLTENHASQQAWLLIVLIRVCGGITAGIVYVVVQKKSPDDRDCRNIPICR